MIKNSEKFTSSIAFRCFTPSQVALADFLKNKDAYIVLLLIMQQKRDHFINADAANKVHLLN